uniref:Zinc finger, CCHC-type n=1 Tax=Tanacetum cinerariifolium TaxID=118510 RepID=A0A6L2L3K2_TANCI|nr:zinc finger, CCHC-type [Tanacetum cinerariifolium]
MKIDPHHFNAESILIEYLLNHDSSIISSSLKIDSHLDEFAVNLLFLKQFRQFVSKNSNAEIKSFSPSPIPIKDSDSLIEEIDLFFTLDDPMPPGIKDDDYDSERDILILEELLDNYSLSLPKIESYDFDIPSFFRPPAKPPDVVQYSRKLEDSCQRILSSKSSFPQLQLGIIDPTKSRNLHAHEILWELKTLFAQQAEQELLQTIVFGNPVTLGLGEGKNKKAYAPKPNIPPPPKREDAAKDSICHKCGETGHWKRNCPRLLHLAGSQPMLKSSYKAKASVIISIPPLVGGVADVVVEIKGTGFLLKDLFASWSGKELLSDQTL